MAAYRAYSIEEGLVVRARLIEARSNDEALATAADFGWAHWQLWQGSRLIGSSDTSVRGSVPAESFGGIR
jgi:hypothetical protein